MKDEPTWQAGAIEQLSQFFQKDHDVRAFILCGSFASPQSEADIWSDVDAKIILAGHALERYFSSSAWLAPFGKLVGAERHENSMTKTLRICMEGFRRFDLVFIAESMLKDPTLKREKLFPPPYVVLWSKIPNIETLPAFLLSPMPFQDISREQLEKMVDEFWFKAARAIAKVMRNDLLIGCHLALDLTRDSLVLQMIRRDREKQTTIHRSGGWGNGLVTRFSWNNNEHVGKEILDFVKMSCEIFEELAADLLPDYESRAPLLFPTLEHAKQVCQERMKAGQ